MLNIFMGKCCLVQAFLPISSLDEPALYDCDGESVDLVETIPDPRSENAFTEYSPENIIDVRAFVENLPPRLREIAQRLYWRDQSHEKIAADLGVTRSAIGHAQAKIHMLGRAYFGLATD